MTNGMQSNAITCLANRFLLVRGEGGGKSTQSLCQLCVQKGLQGQQNILHSVAIDSATHFLKNNSPDIDNI